MDGAPEHRSGRLKARQASQQQQCVKCHQTPSDGHDDSDTRTTQQKTVEKGLRRGQPTSTRQENALFPIASARWSNVKELSKQLHAQTITYAPCTSCSSERGFGASLIPTPYPCTNLLREDSNSSLRSLSNNFRHLSPSLSPTIDSSQMSLHVLAGLHCKNLQETRERHQ